MTQNYIGQILMFGGNFAPTGYAMCTGQTLPISQNQALFSVLGTTYGGNGTTIFILPDMRSRLTNHWGQGPGLSSYAIGQNGGALNATLLPTNMPAHTHTLSVSQGTASTGTVGPSVVPATANEGATALDFYAAAQAGQAPLTTIPMAPGTCAPTGGGAAHSNLMPSLCISFIIALQGLYPSRS